jgi:hypothetical protein
MGWEQVTTVRLFHYKIMQSERPVLRRPPFGTCSFTKSLLRFSQKRNLGITVKPHHTGYTSKNSMKNFTNQTALSDFPVNYLSTTMTVSLYLYHPTSRILSLFWALRRAIEPFRTTALRVVTLAHETTCLVRYY